MKLSFVFLYFFFSEMTSLLQTQNGEFKSRNYKMKNYPFVWYNNDTREVDAFWGKLRGVIYNNKLGHVWVIICCKNISKNIFLFLLVASKWPLRKKPATVFCWKWIRLAQLQNPLKRKCEIWVIINSQQTVRIIVSYLLHLRCKSIAPVYCTIICSDISNRYKSRVVIICSKIKEHSEDVEVNDVL